MQCNCISIHWCFPSDGPNVSTPILLYVSIRGRETWRETYQSNQCTTSYDTYVPRRYYASMLTQDRTFLDGLQGEPINGASKALWPVMMTYLKLWKCRPPRPIARMNLPVWAIRCQLYTSKVHTKVNDFRWWFFYSNRAAEEESLPPTTGLLVFNETLRSNDLEKGWESRPHLPSPVNCGLEFDTTRHQYTLEK